MLVSIVIPAFRSASYIARALDSVFVQTFRNHEVLVVNDGSPDTDVLERVLQRYQERIHYIKQDNCGPSAARNTGIRQAKGDYVAFLDSDDVWFSDHLAKHVAMLHNNRVLGLVYSDSILMREEGLVGTAFGQQPQHPPVSFESLLVEDCAVITSSVVASRAAIIDAGLFDEQFSRCEDFDLWLRMAFSGMRMDFCGEPTLYHRISNNGLSSNHYLMKRALIDVYKKIASTLPLSSHQQHLIEQCICRTDAACHLELLKQHLASAEYALALQAGERAQNLVRRPKLKLAILGLKLAPHLARCCYQGYERWLSFRNRVRIARSARNLKRLLPRAELTFSEPKFANVREDSVEQTIHASE